MQPQVDTTIESEFQPVSHPTGWWIYLILQAADCRKNCVYLCNITARNHLHDILLAAVLLLLTRFNHMRHCDSSKHCYCLVWQWLTVLFFLFENSEVLFCWIGHVGLGRGQRPLPNINIFVTCKNIPAATSRQTHEKKPHKKTHCFWGGNWVTHELSHLCAALFGLVTQTKCLSHMMLWWPDDLSCRETNQPLPRCRRDLTQAVKVTRKRWFVSRFVSAHLAPTGKRSSADFKLMTDGVRCNSNDSSEGLFSYASHVVHPHHDQRNDRWHQSELLLSISVDEHV